MSDSGINWHNNSATNKEVIHAWSDEVNNLLGTIEKCNDGYRFRCYIATFISLKQLKLIVAKIEEMNKQLGEENEPNEKF